jgi:hypothetical protein
MSELSNMANCIRTGMFLNPKATLTMWNERSEFTPEAAAAMDELVSGGFIAVEAQGKMRRYSLTEAGEALPKMSFDWMMEHGTISLTQPIRGAKA